MILWVGKNQRKTGQLFFSWCPCPVKCLFSIYGKASNLRTLAQELVVRENYTMETLPMDVDSFLWNNNIRARTKYNTHYQERKKLRCFLGWKHPCKLFALQDVALIRLSSSTLKLPRKFPHVCEIYAIKKKKKFLLYWLLHRTFPFAFRPVVISFRRSCVQWGAKWGGDRLLLIKMIRTRHISLLNIFSPVHNYVSWKCGQ